MNTIAHIRPSPRFQNGDLLTVKGYGNKVWEVIGYGYEFMSLRGKEDEFIYYNLSCVITGEFNMGDQDDAFRVCTASFAMEYIRQLDKDGKPPLYTPEKLYSLPQIRKEESKMKATNDTQGKEDYVYAHTVDGLLEELSDLLLKGDIRGEIDEDLQGDIDVVKGLLEAAVAKEDKS